MKGATGELFKYNSTWHAFKVIVKSEGVYGLFKGMWPNLLKVKILYNAFFLFANGNMNIPIIPDTKMGGLFRNIHRTKGTPFGYRLITCFLLSKASTR